MVVFPNAKINLGLNIVDKRKDGFHNIETVFYPLSLSDILEIQANKEDNISQITNTGIMIDVPEEKNLCFQAYAKLSAYNNLPPVNIHLHKIIPFGSGLGGGSSDAAFTLTVLNELFKLNISSKKLRYFAENLGSDCPFFIKNVPCFAYEKGNKLEEIPLSLQGYYLFIVVPNIQISTKLAYQEVKPQKPTVSLKNTLIKSKPDEWKGYIKNDFEGPLFKIYPVLRDIKDKLYQNNAVFASLSGSGSAVYGLFKNEPPSDMRFDHSFTWKEKL